MLLCFWMWIHQFSWVLFFGCYCVIPVTLFIIRSKGSTEKNSRRSGQPSSKQGLDCLHNNSPPAKKKNSHQRTHRIHSRQVSFIYLIEKEKKNEVIFSVRRPQYYISHTKSQRSFVTRHRLSCDEHTCNVRLGRLWSHALSVYTRTKSNFR